MRANRRGVLAGGIAGAALFLTSFFVAPAWALTQDQARAHVQATVDDLMGVLRTPGGPEARAPQLRRVIETRGNLPRIAQFAAGRVWKQMSPPQQQRFVDAFAAYVSRNYSRRFDEISGDPQITVGRIVDAGQKGMLVETPASQGRGRPISVEWLVSDRGGRTEIIDIIVEGISIATNERDQIASMFQKRGNNVDALISDLGG